MTYHDSGQVVIIPGAQLHLPAFVHGDELVHDVA